MINFKHTILRLAVSSCVLVSVSAFAITPFEATYQFSYNGKNISTATRSLSQLSNGTWNYNFSAKAGFIASASESSQFNIKNGQLISNSFNRTTKYIGISDKLRIDFNHANNTIYTQKNDTKRRFKLENNPLDELNAEIQIREDILNKKLKPAYYITDAKGVDARKFVNLGEETIQTPYGTLNTVKFKLEYNKPERNTMFWLAPQFGYLPVKVAHNDDGNSYGISLISYKNP
ncbi:DUF3108 domain-containing protein [Acinetobacter rathckeae]|uniref:DUF3108 domain-containing protein n=1 Tax=Acinetobacter rathckeae TaxID=2605272 RepID=UPI0018A28B25|nr:DUF3108 domain-containing protein [Acinetobacter rathckeae]MBF7688516.1 DUF3108 domain-containing protein [Acinetobacter rathckeae]MBF7695600.1 DUF3108 domain-containing protein [Acinetobacter rathckeae]